MVFERKWSRRGTLSDEELETALSLALSDQEINGMLDELARNVRAVRLGNAKRDEELEDRVDVKAYQLAASAFPKATISDGREIGCHLFEELARRLESSPRDD